MQIFQDFNVALNAETWDLAARDFILARFLKNFQGNSYARSLEIQSRENISAIVQGMRELLQHHQEADSINFYSVNRFVAYHDDLVIFVTDSNRDHFRSESNIPRINRFVFAVYGKEQLVVQMCDNIREKFRDDTFAKVNWYYKDSYGVESQQLYIDNDRQIHDEFYPYFPQGVNSFIDEYLRHNASVMVLFGPPGTGKTSFLKHLLCRSKLDAIVSYDEAVLSDDRLFIDFLTTDNSDVMIVEDADLLLTSRESDQNKIMSKFLNVSDGLVKVRDKKMVFTTNIAQINKIDPALLRTGRCFAAVEFRYLTQQEAAQAAAAAALPTQDWSSQPQWRLADLWRQEMGNIVESADPSNVGFRPNRIGFAS
jgi:ATPase family associated with various cellular activities (AAA)